MPYGGGFRRNKGFRRFPRKQYKIICSECGKEAEVPFKPREGTPVYCRECFFKKKGITPRQPIESEESSEEIEESSEEPVEEAEEEVVEEPEESSEDSEESEE